MRTVAVIGGGAGGMLAALTAAEDKNNRVVLGSNEDLFSDTAFVKDVNWISGELPKEPLRIRARIRYNKKEQPATLYPLENNCIKVVFDEPQRAITPGQAIVCYDGDIILGGGQCVSSAG